MMENSLAWVCGGCGRIIDSLCNRCWICGDSRSKEKSITPLDALKWRLSK